MENNTEKEVNKIEEVTTAVVLRNSKNEYAGPGTGVMFRLTDDSVIEGTIEKLMYGGDILLTNGVMINLSRVKSFVTNLK